VGIGPLGRQAAPGADETQALVRRAWRDAGVKAVPLGEAVLHLRGIERAAIAYHPVALHVIGGQLRGQERRGSLGERLQAETAHRQEQRGRHRQGQPPPAANTGAWTRTRPCREARTQ
jgi:hypothetical protein